MQTKAQHTPGPWTAGGSEMTLATWVKGPDGKRICSMRECEHDFHNAKLIAAAPDLYEALLAFIQIDSSPTIHGAMPVALRDFRYKALAALAKAAA
jgi:hypothetical protein